MQRNHKKLEALVVEADTMPNSSVCQCQWEERGVCT